MILNLAIALQNKLWTLNVLIAKNIIYLKYWITIFGHCLLQLLLRQAHSLTDIVMMTINISSHFHLFLARTMWVVVIDGVLQTLNQLAVNYLTRSKGWNSWNILNFYLLLFFSLNKVIH